MALSQSGPAENGAVRRPERGSTFEPFFDLVFVFTVTQLTAAIARDLTLTGITRVVVTLAVVWWLHGDFVRLTNAAPPDTPTRRCLPAVGAAGFLVVALAVPHAFHDLDSATAFGWGFLVAVGAHTAMYAASIDELPDERRGFALRRVAAVDAASAALVVIGAFLGGTAQPALWGAAAVVRIVAPFVTGGLELPLRTRPFVERYGLVTVFALGASVIAIGADAQGLDLDLRLLATAVLTLLLAFALWWAYFGDGEEERAVALMSALPARRRTLRGLVVYGGGHYALLLGVLLFAAGVKTAVDRPTDRLDAAQACTLAGGLALFLAANAVTRWSFRIHPNGYRVGAVVSLAATVPLGMFASALAEIAAIVAVLTVAGVLEAQRYPEPEPEPEAPPTAPISGRTRTPAR
ncbi:low temperature requirement protein A [Yinghuangia sp. ASG 101]|uniref:low temperature requirement protein A n=1 Tax=Yinghuangia sp. ASG 101 TaxID=2896848 RepID=UPI001E3EE899|nr:low temperature requirement protein A [Yinghuangia sp. ASG 101]UGQ14760.1 low temperature requirement protein A [Yinghuangia sp. ASG 101]